MSSILKKIAIIGSGNWGSVIAKIVGYNVQALDGYELRVPMYVYEEQLENGKLTDLINQTHENVKYLPGVKLPENIVALPSVLDCAKDADILVFVVPHQFVKGICKQLRGQIKSDAIAISLIKGLDVKDTGLNLISNVIHESLDIDCAVLMGANIASEVANENYCEATIGCSDKIKGKMLKKLFQTSYFRIVVVDDVQTVEMCGALKTILYIAALIAEGLDIIANTKAAIVRLGFLEIVEFTRYHFKHSKIETFLESCGVADLVTTCYSGRNKKIAEAFVHSGKTIEELEKEMLNGQKLQGPPTAAEVYEVLHKNNMEEKYPLFTAIHYICIGKMKPEKFIDCLKNHPAHM